MNIYRSLEEIPFYGNTCLTLGGFDGIHTGHTAIIDKLLKDAADLSARSLLITFDPHPLHVLRPEIEIHFLTTLEEKLVLLEQTGLDAVLILPFDTDLANTSASDFVTDILQKRIGLHKIVVGHDHAFGHDRQGGLKKLCEMSVFHGFEIDVLEPVYACGTLVSSTKIREFIQDGQISQANTCLGRGYTLSGVVDYGERVGQSIGFPTANLRMKNSNKLIPMDGIYAGVAYHQDREYDAMLYIGNAPTLENKKHRIEAHLLDYNGYLYGETLQIGFIDRIRDNKKFNTIEQLKLEINEDSKKIKLILEKHPWRFTWL